KRHRRLRDADCPQNCPCQRSESGPFAVNGIDEALEKQATVFIRTKHVGNPQPCRHLLAWAGDALIRGAAIGPALTPAPRAAVGVGVCTGLWNRCMLAWRR
ncbi:MAG TPA: hypothetical protein VKE51_42125, partial [Vicinamibacterales bacterium]|nr:hypothetical protein [Vicinamibacterales bacterium]